MDMKVLVYSNFFPKKIERKNKSPSSMNNGRYHPPKCKGKVKKTREETLKGLFSNLFISCICCPPFWANVVNSCWLAPTHALPVQTSLNFFVYP
jgi:hypothetical protein